ncbi:Cu,Zn superoxide dismutase-like protein [Dothidotthia symphoricarpi CBS 119687]|uniref:superoxide dismutase n=1 Tax=Dothidotthia symphoricarpi CBS 119687 TaxID=1392245 RepID=A0A6A6AJJ0_9PLEO|nr:Cu,Zn superoxide dismutase-like protein [Dothidotthia symphoricarpi CBS 119687]KAF2131736.1 Cu,Zn superoxide dismutase-like protein [Dothidotthia symphoricarpi CBS 119687]
MRVQLLSVLAAASAAVSAQSSTIVPAPVVTGNHMGPKYIATLPEKEGSTVRGSIAAMPATDGTGVKFDVSISGLPAEGGPFMYHLHAKPVPSDGNCTGTGAHLDPYMRGEVPACDASKPETCQTGDLSGKHGNITSQEWSQEYVDLYSATRSDDVAFFGNLSVVVHMSDKKRIACANFTLAAMYDPIRTLSYLSTASSGFALPTGSGVYNTTALSTPTGSRTGVPISPSASSTGLPESNGAAEKLIGGTAAIFVAAAALML